MEVLIQVDDEGMQVTVDGGEPYECEGLEDCLEYVERVLTGEEDMQMMWDEEAGKRGV